MATALDNYNLLNQALTQNFVNPMTQGMNAQTALALQQHQQDRALQEQMAMAQWQRANQEADQQASRLFQQQMFQQKQAASQAAAAQAFGFNKELANLSAKNQMDVTRETAKIQKDASAEARIAERNNQLQGTLATEVLKDNWDAISKVPGALEQLSALGGDPNKIIESVHKILPPAQLAEYNGSKAMEAAAQVAKLSEGATLLAKSVRSDVARDAFRATVSDTEHQKQLKATGVDPKAIEAFVNGGPFEVFQTALQKAAQDPAHNGWFGPDGVNNYQKFNEALLQNLVLLDPTGALKNNPQYSGLLEALGASTAKLNAHIDRVGEVNPNIARDAYRLAYPQIDIPDDFGKKKAPRGGGSASATKPKTSSIAGQKTDVPTGKMIQDKTTKEMFISQGGVWVPLSDNSVDTSAYVQPSF